MTVFFLRRVAGWLVLGLLVLSYGPVRAQTTVQSAARHRYWEADADSLRQVLSGHRSDTARLRTLLHLIDCSLYASELAGTDLAAVVALTKHLRRPEHRAYRLLLAGTQVEAAAALDSLQAAVTAFDQLSRPAPWLLARLREVFSALNREDARLAYYQAKCAQYLRSGDTISLAVCYHALGGSYTYRGDYNQATSQYLRAAELGRSVSPNFYHGLLVSVAGSYAKWGNYAKALHYLRLSTRTRNSRTNRGTYLRLLGYVYFQQRDYPAALRAADQVLTFAAGSGPAPARSILNAKAYALVLKSQSLLALGHVAEAGGLLPQAQHLADSLRLPLVTTAAALELDAAWAQYYVATGDQDRAETHWLAAYGKARQAHSTPLRLAYLRELTRFYQQQGKPAPAARYAVAALALADSLDTKEGAMHVARYEIEQADRAQTARIAGLRQAQQQDAARARRQRNILWAVLGGASLIAGFSFLLWRSNRLKQRANEQLERQRDETAQALTELRTTQAQLIQKEKMASLGELTAGIAHEIQNPLNFVTNFSDVSTELMLELQEAHLGGDGEEVAALAGDVTENLTKIRQHGQRASSIVRGMLEHARPSSGERIPTNINALCEEYLRLAYQGQRTKTPLFEVEVITDFAPQIPLTNLVAADLGRVLLNLYSNAFYALHARQQGSEQDFTPTLRVSTKHGGKHVEIRVEDNATGMPESVQAKIFQPFFTTKPTGEGTGLGLSLSYDIIAQGHGGTLSVESQEGRGTTFIITLPV
ncbi:ATP-binding protein [Hymenobacter sp. BT188]|uniref:ATP-binding protein n=1 Tax=Hymenobacter sp. BT188 TaxID=2763504 RepID=UPI0021C79B97|nr:ATP-binding protein [Hymenobacter sp. BT188]